MSTTLRFTLDSVFAALGIDPLADGVQIAPSVQIKPPEPFTPLLPFVPTRPLLICSVDDVTTVRRVSVVLSSIYPPEHPIIVVDRNQATSTVVAALATLEPAPGLCIYVPPLATLAAVRSLDTLSEITARLRAPGGCPWDRQQTHDSLKPYVLEETYEVLDALDSGDRAELCEELGDLMMQVMIHSQIAAEHGEFSLGDVLAGISSKLIRRHPHVFGDVQVSGTQDVLRNWQTIKQAEKPANGDKPPASLLGGVPVQLPALAYARAIQERSGRLGFARPSEALFDLLPGAIAAVRRAAAPAERLSAYGDLLFVLVQVGHLLDVEAEEALRVANRRFRERFMAVEALARQRELDMSTLDAVQREEMWDEAGRAAGGAA